MAPQHPRDRRLQSEGDGHEAGAPHQPEQLRVDAVGPRGAVERQLQAAPDDPFADEPGPLRRQREGVVEDVDGPRLLLQPVDERLVGGQVVEHPLHPVIVDAPAGDGREAAVGAVLVTAARRQEPDIAGGQHPVLVGRRDVVQAGEVLAREGGERSGARPVDATRHLDHQVLERLEQAGQPPACAVRPEDGPNDPDDGPLAGAAQAGIGPQQCERLFRREGGVGAAGQDHRVGKAVPHHPCHGATAAQVALVGGEADHPRPPLGQEAGEGGEGDVPLGEVLLRPDPGARQHGSQEGDPEVLREGGDHAAGRHHEEDAHTHLRPGPHQAKGYATLRLP